MAKPEDAKTIGCVQNRRQTPPLKFHNAFIWLEKAEFEGASIASNRAPILGWDSHKQSKDMI